MTEYDYTREPSDVSVCVECYGFIHYPDESSDPAKYREANKYLDFAEEPQEHFHGGGYPWCRLCETKLGGGYYDAHDYS